MKTQLFQTAAVGFALTSALFAQNMQQRQATMVGGGGGPDRGKCTIEVVVDDVAQVEVRGTTATLHTLSGQPSQWRRFECNSPMPPNPVNFRFAGVDGRGRQDLVRDPRQGGVAIVQIEDKQGGSEGYTFDLFWENSRSPVTAAPQPVYPERDQRAVDQRAGDQRGDRGDEGRYRPNYRDSDYFQRYGHGFSADEAIRICQQEVMNQASRRFRNPDIHFNRTYADDQPGRDDWVTGTLDVPRGRGEDRYRFSCSMNFESGRLRSAQIDDRPLSNYGR